MGEMISMRAFAKLDGCAESLVRRGVKEGRLSLSEQGKLDSSLVGTQWRTGNISKPQTARTKTRAKVRTESARTVKSAQGAQAVVAEILESETPEKAAARLASKSKVVPLYADSMAKKEHFLSLTRELEYQQKNGSLVDITVAETVLFECARSQRDSWLNWPARVGPLIAAELDVEADRVTEILTKHIHAHIEKLGEPSADFRKG